MDGALRKSGDGLHRRVKVCIVIYLSSISIIHGVIAHGKPFFDPKALRRGLDAMSAIDGHGGSLPLKASTIIARRP